MTHAGAMTVPERVAPAHGAVQEGGRAEETAALAEEERAVTLHSFNAYGRPL